jgi:signal transduction histidine kinase
LAIVGSIMKVHGGSMTIGSRPGQGTVVTLVFPDASDKPTLTAAVAAS